ncbi:MAG: 2-oxo acid dehydrogenase subunit E2 [Bdellovibrionales bacterium]|nr:2-oxo acid dehydrogenase subunit E2 [Bdellovibrionales bacterium]
MKKYKSIKPSLAEVNSWSLNEVLIPRNMVAMSALVSSEALDNYRKKHATDEGLSPSYTALILKAVYGVLKKYPEANRAIIGPPFFKKIIHFNSYDINVAVEKDLPNIPGQAYAPTIRNVDTKSVLEITKELKFYAQCTEANDRHYSLFMRILRYTPWPFAKWIISLPYWIPSLWQQHKGGACWVNSPSKTGPDLAITAWPWPITFSFGVIKKRALVIDDEVKAVNTIPLIISFDRRLMGGGPAGRIFSEFKRIVEEADPSIYN